MPCSDPRDHEDRKSLADHHFVLEWLVERMVADERVPAEYRKMLEMEQRTYAADRKKIDRSCARARSRPTEAQLKKLLKAARYVELASRKSVSDGQVTS